MVAYVVHSMVVDQLRETVTLEGGERVEIVREVMSIELAPVDSYHGFLKLAVQRSDKLAQLKPGARVEATFSVVE